MIKKNVKILLLIEFVIAVYMIATLARSEYNSNQIEKYIEKLEAENMQIVLENEELKSDFDYYSSPQYQEKIAKQNLGKINPGEKVLVISNEKSVEDEISEMDLIPDEVLENQNRPNWEKWWMYFTGIGRS